MTTGLPSNILELVLNAGDIGLWCWDSEQGRVCISDSWFEITGHDAAPIRQMLERLPESALTQKEQIKHVIEWWAESVHPDDLGEAKRAVERYLLMQIQTEDGYENVYRFWQPKDKDWITLSSKGEALWRGGKIESLVIVQKEVTEWAKAESRLLDRIAKLEAQSEEMVSVFTLDVSKLRKFVRRSAVSLATVATIAISAVGAMTEIGQDILEGVSEGRKITILLGEQDGKEWN